VNLILNMEQEGFAHSHYLTHGPTVAALGLWVSDASAQTAAPVRRRVFEQSSKRRKKAPGPLPPATG
jgi:4-hydroxyphenylpyruvate dioxygenase